MADRSRIKDIVPLIVYSNPSDTGRIRLDYEAKAIDRLIKEFGIDQENFVRIHAANKQDIFQNISERRFSIIQFSGHGASDGIFLEGNVVDGCSQINVDVIKEILTAASPNLVIAIFLSCFSADMAEKLIEFVPNIVSVSGAASDRGCIDFAEAFYRTLYRSGGSLSKSFLVAQGVTQGDIKASMYRRALRDGCRKNLVVHSSYGGKEILIDIGKAITSAKNLGISLEELSHLLSSKLRYHMWAFRFSRHKVIFPVGNYFCLFSWENADDCVDCEKIFKIRDDIDENLAMVYADLIVSYHDCCVADYRSPFSENNTEQKIKPALNNLNEMVEFFFEEEKISNILKKHVRVAFVAAKALCLSNIRMANNKFHQGEWGNSIVHMEAVISSVHDLIDAVSEISLE